MKILPKRRRKMRGSIRENLAQRGKKYNIGEENRQNLEVEKDIQKGGEIQNLGVETGGEGRGHIAENQMIEGRNTILGGETAEEIQDQGVFLIIEEIEIQGGGKWNIKKRFQNLGIFIKEL